MPAFKYVNKYPFVGIVLCYNASEFYGMEYTFLGRRIASKKGKHRFSFKK